MPTIRPALVGSASEVRGTGTGAITISHTVPVGTEALLIYVVQRADFLLADVKYGGVHVPLLNAHNLVNMLPWTFELLNPTPGTANIVVTPDPSASVFISLAIAAVNVVNYGGVRFADWAFADTVSPVFTPQSSLHTEPTDLVLSCVAQINAGGAAVTPVGLSLILSQAGTADGLAKLALGQCDAVSDYTTVSWTIPDNNIFDVHVMAIKGIDGVPSGVPYAIGPVTNTLCVEDQPAPAASSPGPIGVFPLPGTPWRWAHTIPSTHRTLVVLLAWQDGTAPVVTVDLVTADDVLVVSLSDYYSPGNNRAMFLLENAPVGTYFIRVSQAPARRTFMAGAYSIASEGIVATNSGIDTLKSLTIDTEPEAIAIALVDYARFEPYDYVNGGADVGSGLLWTQPIYFNSNLIEGNRPNINGTADCGLSVYTVATGATATPAWTSTQGAIFTTKIGFSFVPSPAPPPPPDTGCPNTLGPIPAGGGTGCSATLPTG